MFSRWLPWRQTPTLPPAPFVVGAPRSGTTLLRVMLDAHPALCIPPETQFVIHAAKLAEGPELRERFFALVTQSQRWGDFGLTPEEFAHALQRTRSPFTLTAGLRCFYELCAKRDGKPRWGEKTPGYGVRSTLIEGLLPEAHFIHIIRDGRAVAASLRKVWFSSRQAAAELAEFWRQRVERTRDEGSRCKKYLEVRYEDLVIRPDEVLRRICEFIHLPYDAGMLNYHADLAMRLGETKPMRGADGRLITPEERLAPHRLLESAPDASRIDAWRAEFSPEEIRVFDDIAGPLLRSLGYATSGTRHAA